MTSKPSAFDLDAVLGELADKTLTYKGQQFTLPAELPAAAFTPLLSDDLGLIDLVTEVITEADQTAEWDDLVIAALKKAPSLPKALIEAFRLVLVELLGDDQYAGFMALRPSVQAYLAIGRGVVTEYGVALAGFFGSDESSDTDGEPSKPTSSDTTDSTPEASGDDQATPASSE